jgi:hypothetical protein
MKIADILRRLADNIDGHSQGGQPDPALQNPAELQAVPTGQNIVVVDTDTDDKPSPNGTTASGNDREPEELFLPPLQQKQELLKKAVGVENVYDDGRPGDASDENAEAPTPEEEDLLDRIKRMAGVPVAAIQELSNDEVFDD